MPEQKAKISSMAVTLSFFKGKTCSELLTKTVNEAYDQPLSIEERAATPLAGGIMQNGYQCGMIWGATLAAGAQAYRQFGPGPEAQTRATEAAKQIAALFQSQNETVNCVEITEIDKTSTTMQMITYFLLKGGTIGCAKMAGKFAPEAIEKIEAAFTDDQIDVPASPVSCTAMLAEKLGTSDLHSTMAAGLAGGIGLCGSACGALGTAIWLMGIKILEERNVKNLWGDKEFSPKLDKLIDTFLKTTDYEFECSEIVGHKFESVLEHADYLRDGGCATTIEALATSVTELGE